MSDRPQDPQNPFEGTPFEQFFKQFGGQFGAGAPGAGANFDLNQIMAQIQQMMQGPADGSLNWDAALDIARRTATAGGDPVVSAKQSDAVADALHLADLWLEGTTTFASGVVTASAWSRTDWLLNTLEMWKVLVAPVTESATGPLRAGLEDQLPSELAAMAGPIIGQLTGLLSRAMGAMYANQAGSGLGTLATEVLSASEIGVPLTAPGRAALVPTNIAAFADGLGVSNDDVLLFLSLREAAHQRLFAGVGWLREYVIDAVRAFAGGVEVNMEAMQRRIEEQMRGIDPARPEQLAELMEGGIFEVPTSPAQKAALERLEIVLALVEGWVDEVVAQATATRMPVAAKLAETVRRRRAAGGPAEQTFATLVGLELRPRRLRDAAALWGSLRARQGIEGRDGVWMSPALLPTSSDLDDPLGFREGSVAGEALSEDDFDAELRKLLDGDA